jgi:hypothetical protein
MVKTRREAKNEYSRNKFDFWDGVDTYNSILCSQKAERLSLSNSTVSSLNHRDDFDPAQWFDYTIREELSQIRMNSIREMTPNPCNIPVSAIPKRQVSQEGRWGSNFVSTLL